MPDATDGAVALVLAAGSGRRFGGGKVVADLHGRPLLAHVIGAARAAGLPALVVVPADAAVGTAARDAGAATVANPDPRAGMGSSLAVGLSALPVGTGLAVVLLGDQPTIDPQAIRTVLAARRADPDVPWRARYDDGPGHPVALPRGTWDLLAQARGDVGARDLLAALGTREVPVGGPRPPDVDVVADLEALRAVGSR